MTLSDSTQFQDINMCVSHAKHSFPSRCKKYNTIEMDAWRCERFNHSSSSSLWENTDSFLSESVSVVLHESKETLESAWRLQNEGLPLWTCATMGLRVVIIVSYWFGQITPLFLSTVTVGIHMHRTGHTNTHNPDLRKATSHKREEVGESMHMLIMDGQILVLQLIKATDGLMKKQSALVWLCVETFHSLHGLSQLSLKSRWYADRPHTRGICQTDEGTPKIDCISDG